MVMLVMSKAVRTVKSLGFMMRKPILAIREKQKTPSQMMSSKEMKETLRALQQRGFFVEVGRKHYKVRSPSGRLYTCSISPSCPHAHKNLMRDIEKYERNKKTNA